MAEVKEVTVAMVVDAEERAGWAGEAVRRRSESSPTALVSRRSRSGAAAVARPRREGTAFACGRSVGATPTERGVISREAEIMRRLLLLSAAVACSGLTIGRADVLKAAALSAAATAGAWPA